MILKRIKYLTIWLIFFTLACPCPWNVNTLVENQQDAALESMDKLYISGKSLIHGFYLYQNLFMNAEINCQDLGRLLRSK